MGRDGQDGQTAAEVLGVLLLVSVIVATLATSSVGSAIAGEVERLVCRIGAGGCEDRAATVSSARIGEPSGGPSQGPAIPDGPLDVLPFPGTVSVTCGYGEGAKENCKVPDGARVRGTATVTRERTPTKLDAAGCPQQTLSVATTLQLELANGRERGKASGELAAYVGHQSKYAVTVAPDQADAIEQGRRQAPNPLDPRTIGPGESVQLSEEFYAGLGLSADYRALQAELGYQEGRRVSAGVTRVDAGTVRVYVGDEDFVRHAMSLGVGGADFGVRASANREIADGKLRAVEIDVSTAAGWEAYQRFVTSGRLPAPGTPGTKAPTRARTRTFSDSAGLEAQAGKFGLGIQLKDAEGSYAETTAADGGVKRELAIRYNDVGLEVTTAEDAAGHEVGDRTYALNLEGVRPDVYANFQALNHGDTASPPGGDVRWTFSGSDLMDMRTQALEQIAWQMEQRGVEPRPTAAEVAANLERNDGVIRVDGVEYWPDATAGLLANARSPEEVLEALYRLANGDPNQLLAGPLTDFALKNAQANGDKVPGEQDRLPGEVGAPSCPR